MGNSRLDRFLGFFEPASQKRLSEEIDRFQIELNVLTDPSKLKDPVYAANAISALNSSRLALQNGKIQSGWTCLHEAQCLSVFLLDNNMLKTVADAIVNEGKEKLDDWRLNTLKDLLCDSNGKLNYSNLLNVSQVYEARKILLEHHNNTYIKNDRHHTQIIIMAYVSIFLIPAMILSMSWFFGQSIALLSAIALFGAAGGTISAIHFVAGASKKDKIPDQLRGSWSILIRPLIGAISALVVSVFLLAGILQIGTLSNYLLLAISFISGFSERLILSVVEKTGNV